MTHKVALVTGGSRGIGAAIARQLAEQGFDIAISYARNKVKADEIAEYITGLGRKAVLIQADGSTVAGNQLVIKETVKQLGRLDVLVCNAGMGKHKTITEATSDDIEEVLNLNLRGMMVETSEAAKVMSEGGRIVLMGSAFAGRVPFEGLSIYSATKAGLRGFAQGVARDLGKKGITINVVEPGPIDTDLNPGDTEEAKYLSGFVATGAYGQVQDVANTVSFLVSENAGYITGIAMPVDGGLLA
ncbi:SDR family oxidoreductase [Rosenbergiella australiborealis]|uniref:SDR family oxidoreductase n=1 Tax=Rosenbergiella australiborealis TaxID=1544696 RepID=A0ABS5T2N0_9GAMM|nr:SDR family oxidoreductase [Rosenbergiella australiborealis]MBT0726417.1 SDR family oxidoreductase [Rosenbergiella australiborealis]